MDWEELFFEELKIIEKRLRRSIQLELWNPEPNMHKIYQIMKRQADLDDFIANQMGAEA